MTKSKWIVGAQLIVCLVGCSAQVERETPTCAPQTIVEALVACTPDFVGTCGEAETPGCFRTGSPNVSCCPAQMTGSAQK